MTTKKLKALPRGNPFLFDHISVGLDLGQLDPKLKGLYVMHSGTLGEGTYIVDSANGQRIKIER